MRVNNDRFLNKQTRVSLPAGDGWRYRCLTCNFEVGIDKAFPETCQGCGAGGWWGHLVTIGNNGKLSQKIEDGNSIKGTNEIMPGGIFTPKRFLSQQENAMECGLAENNGVFSPPQGRERGRPRQAVPDEMILELSGQGFSSRAMAARLNEQGIAVSYKTIQRRLQASLL